jgi:hypothetical protein
MTRHAITISLFSVIVAVAAAGSAAAPEKVDTRWTLLSSAKLPIVTVPSVARDRATVVVASLISPTAAQAVTFTPSTSRDIVSPVKKPIATSPTPLQNPELFERQGGGLQALVEGIPQLGVSFAPRAADGTFGPPVAAVGNVRATSVGPAVLAPDGAPVWPASYGGDLWLWRGATGATGVNSGTGLAGNEGFPSMGRDSKGRYWVTWYQLAPTVKQNGVYLAQFDPLTLQFIGAPQRAPSSGSPANNNRRAALACSTTCVVAYLLPGTKLTRVLTWAFGEKRTTKVADARGGAAFPVAAFTTGGQLWTAWWNPGTKRYEAKLGNARGAGGGPVLAVGKPAGKGDAGPSAAIASGRNLVLVVTRVRGTTVSRFVNVIKP